MSASVRIAPATKAIASSAATNVAKKALSESESRPLDRSALPRTPFDVIDHEVPGCLHTLRRMNYARGRERVDAVGPIARSVRRFARLGVVRVPRAPAAAWR